MSSARAAHIYQRLGQGPISTDEDRGLRGDLLQLLAPGQGQRGASIVPPTSAHGRSGHDRNVGGFSSSTAQQDDGPWRRIAP